MLVGDDVRTSPSKSMSGAAGMHWKVIMKWLWLNYTLTILLPSRGVGDTWCLHNPSQALIQLCTGRESRKVMDSCQHHLHVRLVLDVSLGPGCPV